MLAEERRIRILQMLEEKNAVQLGELATLFRVSTETVRRDLLALEKQGRLQRTHGGAISMSRMAPDHILTTRIGEHQDLKIELSQRAAQLVHEGETLALDSGSTSAEFAKVLAQAQQLALLPQGARVFPCHQSALPGFEEALDNTVEIARRCNLEFTFGELKLPYFTAPDGRENREYFRSGYRHACI